MHEDAGDEHPGHGNVGAHGKICQHWNPVNNLDCENNRASHDYAEYHDIGLDYPPHYGIVIWLLPVLAVVLAYWAWRHIPLLGEEIHPHKVLCGKREVDWLLKLRESGLGNGFIG
jgi:hypothetical protein